MGDAGLHEDDDLGFQANQDAFTVLVTGFGVCFHASCPLTLVLASKNELTTPPVSHPTPPPRLETWQEAQCLFFHIFR